MDILSLSVGCFVGVLAGVLVGFFTLALCRSAAKQDPESDGYIPLIKGRK